MFPERRKYLNLSSLNLTQILTDVGMIAFALLLVYVVVKLLARPIKALLKLLLHAGAGLLLFWLVNKIGREYFSFYLEPTNLRLVIAAVGGVPGVALMVLYALLF